MNGKNNPQTSRAWLRKGIHFLGVVVLLATTLPFSLFTAPTASAEGPKLPWDDAFAQGEFRAVNDWAFALPIYDAEDDEPILATISPGKTYPVCRLSGDKAYLTEDASVYIPSMYVTPYLGQTQPQIRSFYLKRPAQTKFYKKKYPLAEGIHGEEELVECPELQATASTQIAIRGGVGDFFATDSFGNKGEMLFVRGTDLEYNGKYYVEAETQTDRKRGGVMNGVNDWAFALPLFQDSPRLSQTGELTVFHLPIAQEIAPQQTYSVFRISEGKAYIDEAYSVWFPAKWLTRLTPHQESYRGVTKAGAIPFYMETDASDALLQQDAALTQVGVLNGPYALTYRGVVLKNDGSYVATDCFGDKTRVIYLRQQDLETAEETALRRQNERAQAQVAAVQAFEAHEQDGRKHARAMANMQHEQEAEWIQQLAREVPSEEASEEGRSRLKKRLHYLAAALFDGATLNRQNQTLLLPQGRVLSLTPKEVDYCFFLQQGGEFGRFQPKERARQEGCSAPDRLPFRIDPTTLQKPPHRWQAPANRVPDQMPLHQEVGTNPTEGATAAEHSFSSSEEAVVSSEREGPSEEEEALSDSSDASDEASAEKEDSQEVDPAPPPPQNRRSESVPTTASRNRLPPPRRSASAPPSKNEAEEEEPEPEDPPLTEADLEELDPNNKSYTPLISWILAACELDDYPKTESVDKTLNELPRSEWASAICEKLCYICHQIAHSPEVLETKGHVMKPFPVQLLATLKLVEHALTSDSDVKGAVAEIKTGEGKSFVIALTALTLVSFGRNVDILTLNMELASRDWFEQKALYHALGVSCGYLYDRVADKGFAEAVNLLDADTESECRFNLDALQCKIVYSTNATFQWLYLHQHFSNHTLRGKRSYDVAIVDEADNLLLDQASSPALLAQTFPINDQIGIFRDAYQLATSGKSVEEVFNFLSNNYFGAKFTFANVGQLHQAALIAFSKTRDEDYIIQLEKLELENGSLEDHQIQIIDESTSYRKPASRWGAYVHEMIEIKEGLPLRPSAVIKSAIAQFVYFNFYRSLLGVTGTSGGEREHALFDRYYQLVSFAVPTNKRNKRQVQEKSYATDEELWEKIAAEAREEAANGRSVLVIMRTIRESTAFRNRYFPHSRLIQGGIDEKADKEAIRKAGRAGEITISTGAAGRGTDIKLCRKALEAGGLHVIVSRLPKQERALLQNIGRSARCGQPGTATIYKEANHLYLELAEISLHQLNLYDMLTRFLLETIDRWKWLISTPKKYISNTTYAFGSTTEEILYANADDITDRFYWPGKSLTSEEMIELTNLALEMVIAAWGNVYTAAQADEATYKESEACNQTLDELNARLFAYVPADCPEVSDLLNHLVKKLGKDEAIRRLLYDMAEDETILDVIARIFADRRFQLYVLTAGGDLSSFESKLSFLPLEHQEMYVAYLAYLEEQRQIAEEEAEYQEAYQEYLEDCAAYEAEEAAFEEAQADVAAGGGDAGGEEPAPRKNSTQLVCVRCGNLPKTCRCDTLMVHAVSFRENRENEQPPPSRQKPSKPKEPEHPNWWRMGRGAFEMTAAAFELASGNLAAGLDFIEGMQDLWYGYQGYSDEDKQSFGSRDIIHGLVDRFAGGNKTAHKVVDVLFAVKDCMNVVEIGKHLPDLIKGGAKAIKKFKNTCAAGKKAVKSQGAKQVVKKAVQQTGRAAQQTMKNAAQNMRNVVRDTQQTVRSTVQTVRQTTRAAVQTTRTVAQATVRTTRQVAGAARSGVRSGVQAVRQQANAVRQNLAAAQRNFQANVRNFQAGVRGAPRLAVAGDVGNPGAKFDRNVQQFVQSNPAKYKPRGTGRSSCSGRSYGKKFEEKMEKDLGDSVYNQKSFKNGKEVPYGTKGSTRPDHVKKDFKTSIEDKSYDLSKNQASMIRTIVRQAEQRAKHLPQSFERQVINIDMRGKRLPSLEKQIITDKIVRKSRGIIKDEDIKFH